MFQYQEPTRVPSRETGSILSASLRIVIFLFCDNSADVVRTQQAQLLLRISGQMLAKGDRQDSSKRFLTDSSWPELQKRLFDIQQKRIDFMDEFGVEMMVLSLNAPAIQAIPDTRRAITLHGSSRSGLIGPRSESPKSCLKV